MKKHDQAIIEAFKRVTGKEPELYFYGMEGLSFWAQVFMAGLIGLLFQKPYMMGINGNDMTFIRTSVWKTTTLDEENTFSIQLSNVQESKYKKFGFAEYFQLKMNDGTTKKIVVNKLYKALEKQSEGIEGFKNKLGL